MLTINPDNYTYYKWLYKKPRIKKERYGGENVSKWLSGKYLASIGCDVEKVKMGKETRTLRGQEAAIKQNVIDIKSSHFFKFGINDSSFCALHSY